MYFYQTQIMRSVGITGSLSVQEDIQVSVGGPGGRWKGVRTPRRDLLFSEAHRNGGCEKALFFSGFLFFLHASGAQTFQAFQSQLVLCMYPSFSCGYHHACLTVPSCVFPSAWAATQPVGQRRKGIIHTHTLKHWLSITLYSWAGYTMGPLLAATFFCGTEQHRLVSFSQSGSPSGVLNHSLSE